MSSLHLPVRPPDSPSALPLPSEPLAHLRAIERLELRIALWLLVRHSRRHRPAPTAAEARAAMRVEATRIHLNQRLRDRRELATTRARALDGIGL